MKHFLAVLLALTLAFSLVSCGNNESNEPEKNNQPSTTESPVSDAGTENIAHTGKKIEGTITGASTFSEGLAFVCLNGDKEKTYCINKEGYIVFELDRKLVVNGVIEEKFINGLCALDPYGGNTKGDLIDTTGKITTAEDVGATKFYCNALEGGYIIAEKVTADYSSTKKEIGIMDLSFNWIVEPSEELYESVKDSFTYPAYGEFTYYNDMLYCRSDECWIDLKTGKVITEPSFDIPTKLLSRHSDNTFRFSDEIVLDFSGLENLERVSDFIDGKAVALFHNREASKYFFTLIDEEGNFDFEPIDCDNGVSNFVFDGNTIIITYSSGASVETAKSYDLSGNLLGEFDTSTLEYMSYGVSVNDGVILLRGGYNYSHKNYYFNTDFTPLFDLE